MLRLFKGFMMSIGMFTVIPLPYKKWDEDCTNLMLPCFPFVGVFVGGLWSLTALLMKRWDINPAPSAVIAAAAPHVLTGFLHLDGYMDTCDAALSRRPLEERRRILKDPHAGAFSVIALVLLMLLSFSCMYAILCDNRPIIMLLPICIVSRCGSAIAMHALKPLETSGYAHMYRKNVKLGHKLFAPFVAGITFVVVFLHAGWPGLAAITATAVGYALAMLWAYRSIGGVSGDLAGFALSIGELSGLFALSAV